MDKGGFLEKKLANRWGEGAAAPSVFPFESATGCWTKRKFLSGSQHRGRFCGSREVSPGQFSRLYIHNPAI